MSHYKLKLHRVLKDTISFWCWCSYCRYI